MTEFEAEIERLNTDADKADEEWTDIVYLLVDAIGGQRGKSLPEDVEHARAELMWLHLLLCRELCDCGPRYDMELKQHDVLCHYRIEMEARQSERKQTDTPLVEATGVKGGEDGNPKSDP